MRTRRAWASVAVAAVLIGAAPEATLRAGETLLASASGDLDGDRQADVAYLTGSDERRTLVVKLTAGGTEYLSLELTPLGHGSLTIARGVLVFEDLTGGTTATASTRRYRFDPREARMRLIGLDATRYSRTGAHDGFELSWNLLTGALITRTLRIGKRSGSAAFDRIEERRQVRRSEPVWLFHSPRPDALIDDLQR